MHLATRAFLETSQNDICHRIHLKAKKKNQDQFKKSTHEVRCKWLAKFHKKSPSKARYLPSVFKC